MKKVILSVFTCLLALLTLCAVCVSAYYLHRHYEVEITLNGHGEVTVECGQTYSDPGAAATLYSSMFFEKPMELMVSATGEVDSHTLGTYEITYHAQGRGVSRTATRKVTVVDTQAPVITLETTPGKRTPPGERYEEEGFSATDNYDGDLTAQVVVTMGENTVIYEVSDSSGNRTQVTREIEWEDDDPPELTLEGSRTILLAPGQAFAEPGYSAKDEICGDVSHRVTVDGTVDISTPGLYRLTYTATDYSHNAAKSTRLVVVPDTAEGAPVPNGKVIYLTFDDGPGPYTEKLLDVLKQYNVKATFFTVNTGCVDLIQREAAEGHTVAIHSASHRFNQVYANDNAYFADLEKMSGIIESYTGQVPTLVRFPGGTSNTISRNYNRGIMTRLTEQVEEAGYRYYDWNVDSNDAGGATDTATVVRNVIRGCKDKDFSVVLQHDIRGYSVDAVEQIIKWGQENGYTFLPLTEESPECHHKPMN